MTIGEATIVQDEDYRGRAAVDNPLSGWQHGDGPRRKMLESYVLLLFAGCAAEGELHGREYEVNGTDNVAAHFWLTEYPPPRCNYIGDEVFDKYERKLKRRAQKMVKRHFEKVTTIAELLLRCETLQPDEIYEALRMCSDS